MSTQNPKTFPLNAEVWFRFEYALGETMLVSNPLSRSHLNNIKPKFDKNTLIRHVHFILSNLLITQSRLDQFCLETQKD